MTYAYVNLVATREQTADLASFSQAFFSALGIADYEERESSNYASGSYFSGRQGSIEFDVMESGDVQPEELPFWIDISSASDEGVLGSLIDQQIRERLLPEGFVVTRILDLGKPNERRVSYRP
jgi:hypothetical protein